MKIKMKQSKNQNLPKIWRKVKLGDAVDIIDGDRGKNYPKKEDFSNNGYCVFLDAKNVFGTEFDFSNAQFITKKKDDLLRKGKLERNDFVLTTRGTVGNIAHYGKHVKFNNIRINSGMVILRPKSDIISQKFFNLYLISQKFENQIESFQSGSAQPQLPIRDLKLFEINLPLIEEQKHIANILYPIKNKIELNNKINQNLEQMAQGIFKEWFVDFRFSGYEKSKFIDSEMGRIPEGWEIFDSENVFVFEKGVEPGSASYSKNKKVGYVSFFRVKDLLSNKSELYIPKEVSKNKLCGENDVLLSLDATIGRVQIGCEGAYSSGIRKIYPKADFNFINNSFIYLWIKSNYVQDIIRSYVNSGSTIAHAGNATKDLKISVNKKVILKFQKIANPIFDKILEIRQENQKLSSLRDLLLPKLMKGEIKIWKKI